MALLPRKVGRDGDLGSNRGSGRKRTDWRYVDRDDEFKVDVVIVGAAIKTHYWLELCDIFSKNDATFCLVFSGHV